MKKLFKNIKDKIFSINPKNLSIYNKRMYLWIGFFIYGLILFVSVGFMTICLINSDKYEYKVMNHAYVNAVLPNQSLDQALELGIVKLKEPLLRELKVGDQIVVYGDYNLDVYWVETIVSTDIASKEVEATYDQEITNVFLEEDILGVYVEKANFVGTVFYSASYLKGYLLLTITHGILLYGFYFLFLGKKPKNESHIFIDM